MAASAVQSVRLCQTFKRRTTNDARLERAFEHELMRRGTRSHGSNFTDLVVQLGISLLLRSALYDMSSLPATDMLDQIMAARSAHGILAAHATLSTTPVKRLVQALNAGDLHAGVQASPAILQYRKQEWHRTYQAAILDANEREGKDARGSRAYLASQKGTLLRTYTVRAHEKARLGRRTWCIGWSHGRERRGAQKTSSMCTLFMQGGRLRHVLRRNSLRVNFFASDVAVAQYP